MAKETTLSGPAILRTGHEYSAGVADSACWIATDNQQLHLMDSQIFTGTKGNSTILSSDISTRPTSSHVAQNHGAEEACIESHGQEIHSSPSSSWAALSSPAISETSGTSSINGSRGRSPSDTNQSATPVSSQTLGEPRTLAQEGSEGALSYAPPPFPPPTYTGPIKGLSETRLRDLIPTQPINHNLSEKTIQPVSSVTADGLRISGDNSSNTSPEHVLSKEEKSASYRHRIQSAFDRTLGEILRASTLIPLGLPDAPPSRFEVLDLACLYLAQLSEETIRLREDKALLSEMLARSNYEVTLLTRRASGIVRPTNEMQGLHQVPQQEKKQAGDA